MASPDAPISAPGSTRRAHAPRPRIAPARRTLTDMSTTVADLVARAQAAFNALSATAEPVSDELQYLADLETVWGARLRAVAEARGAEAAPTGAAAAIEALSAEAAAISDPHRAIDWMSTLPQVALAALGEAA